MINEIKNLNIDEKKLMVINEVYLDSRYPGDIGLLPDGIPTLEEASEFLEYAKKVKSIIYSELKN